MKQFILILFLCFSVTNFAQNQKAKDRTPEAMAKQRIEKLDQELKLNEEQKSTLYAYFIKQAEKRKKLVKKRQEMRQNMQNLERESMEEKRELMKKRKKVSRHKMTTEAKVEKEIKETESLMKKTLTPNQFEKWSAMREQRQDELNAKRIKQLKRRKERLSREQRRIER
jgi:hypothetical protein